MDRVYDTFYINGEKFTVEDYDDDKFAVYHEEMFIGTCETVNRTETTKIALNYRLAVC